MFADEGHELFGVVRFDFLLDELVEAAEEVITGHILGADLFEDAQEFDDDLLLQFLFCSGCEEVSNALKKIFAVHHDETLTANQILILPVLESGQQVLRGKPFEGEAFLETQAGIV
jgi:hypothetical protein